MEGVGLFGVKTIMWENMFVDFFQALNKQKSKSYISMDPHFFPPTGPSQATRFFLHPKGDGHIAVKFANAGRPGPSGKPVRRVMTSRGSEPEVAGHDRNFQVTDGWRRFFSMVVPGSPKRW